MLNLKIVAHAMNCRSVSEMVVQITLKALPPLDGLLPIQTTTTIKYRNSAELAKLQHCH
ncbi:hypothetical protein [Neisseria sp.]|uniref:hypothetical protein n=1 Tax=Neisseria sp. TaxID=192066 RepID=UPI0026DB8C09|nr:hypothetical protein [Neisseria sp.]MDO4908187.1 hypothetical protein [Neisseria sp.]